MKKKIMSLVVLLVVVLFPCVISAQVVNNDLSLDKDITDGIIVESGEVTIDLNGKSVSNAENNATIIVKENATLTIIGSGDISNNTTNKPVIMNEGNLVVEGGNYTRTGSYYLILNHGTMTIKNGTYGIKDGAASLIDNGWYTPEQNTSKKMSFLTIDGGTFNMQGNDKYIKNDDYGVMYVNDGVFNMKDPASAVIANVGFYTGKEYLEVNGGEFNYTGSNYAIWDYDWSEYNYEDNSTTIVKGGKYNLSNESAQITNVKASEDSTVNQYPVLGSEGLYIVVDEKEVEQVAVVDHIDENQLDTNDSNLINNAAKTNGYNVIAYYNISSYNALKSDSNILLNQVSETDEKITITLEWDVDLPSVKPGYRREFYVIRVHNGATDIIKASLNEDGLITFESDKFSTYSLTYSDVKIETTNNNSNDNLDVVDNPKTSDSNIILLSIVGLISALGIGISSLYLKHNY